MLAIFKYKLKQIEIEQIKWKKLLKREIINMYKNALFLLVKSIFVEIPRRRRRKNVVPNKQTTNSMKD